MDLVEVVGWFVLFSSLAVGRVLLCEEPMSRECLIGVLFPAIKHWVKAKSTWVLGLEPSEEKLKQSSGNSQTTGSNSLLPNRISTIANLPARH